MTTIEPEISLIIIHWNQERLTVETINSLNNLNYLNLNIILVDNGSDDGSAERISKRFKDISLIRSETNLGYAGGANLGLNKALKSNSEYFFILNNDIVVDANMCNHLISKMEAPNHKKVGICSPKIYYFEPSDRIWFAGGTHDSTTGICQHLGFGEKDNESNSVARYCTFLNGCAMLIRRSVVQKIGLFDVSYFHTGEDVDYSIRAQKAGFKLLCVPEAKLWHKIRASAGGHIKPSYKYNYYEYRNRVLIYKKYFNTSARHFVGKISLSKFYLKTFLKSLLDNNITGAIGIIHGGWHGCIGKTGENK